MRTFSAFVALLTLLLALPDALPAFSQENTPSAGLAAPSALSGLRDRKRAILLFARSRSDAGLEKQLAQLSERISALNERDMVVLVTAGNRDTMASIGYASLPGGSGRELLGHYKPAPRGITMVLVGKDGLEKGRWNHPVDPQEIFDLVDSMPMRQQEMKTGQATN